MHQSAGESSQSKSPVSLLSRAIQARQSETIELGLYPSEDDIPEFLLEFLPDGEFITVERTWLGTPEGVFVTYTFKNTGIRTAMVFIQSRT